MLLRTFTVFSLAAAVFVIASVGLQTPLGMAIQNAIGHVPFGDKTLHFLLMAGLSFLINASLQGRSVQIGGSKILLGSLLAGAAIMLEEISQAFIPGRHFELLDMISNFAGIYSGSLFLPFSRAVAGRKLEIGETGKWGN